LTTGHSVDEAVWSYITMERSCQAQLSAEAVGTPIQISDDVARRTHAMVGTPIACWVNFQPLYDAIVEEQPDLLD
jgi:ribulose-5-phosphate 4-epimerase/fuculose-1-phosphate aldolase